MEELARNWWVLLVRGVLAVVFGVLALIWPGLALDVLVVLFGAFALVDGVFAIAAAIRAAERKRTWWPLVVEGVSGIALGIVAFVWPGITALALLYVIAAWAVVTGVFEIAAAIRLRREIRGEWLLAFAGAASVAFGMLVAIFPGAGALAVVWAIGAYAILFGVLLVALGIRLRGFANEPARA
ncbi:MAG TPA: HdeD family acid-resistance protein [Actinomycetota bacterium]|nr:HdeD family acid-resistance protein [Actinomycetota bacterium]